MPSTEDTTRIVISNKDIILILVQIEDGQKKPSTLDFQKSFTLHGLIKLRVPDLVNDFLNDSVWKKVSHQIFKPVKKSPGAL